MTHPLRVASWPPWLRDRGTVPAADSPSGSVTFPTTPLAFRVQIAVGADLTQPPTSWSWTDITDFARDAITASAGRPDEGSQVQPSSAQLVLSNRDGRFSRRNPNSPYFGQLTFNTPIWVTVNAGAGWVDRVQQFVNEWPVRWDPAGGGFDSTVPIQCAGVMRRLQQGDVLKSAMRRAILGKTQPVPLAYWPCEDGTKSTIVASGLIGGTPMSGTPVFSSTSFGGTAGALNLLAMPDAAGVSALVALPSASGFQVECMAQANVGSSSTALFNIYCGTFTALLVMADSLADGLPHHFSFQFAQNGTGNVNVTIYRDGALSGVVPLSGDLSTSLQILPRNTTVGGTSVLFAHLTVYDFTHMNEPTTRASAASAYNGELATTRIRRLAAEEGVPMVCTSGVSVAMGPEPLGTFLNIVRECEAVDMGVLYETAWGLGYRSVDDLCNQPAALALNFTQIADDPQPADDDQRLRNTWTASRANGSSATAQASTGPLGTAAVGLYNDSATVNVATDLQLADQAGWRLHRDTVDEDRWPNLTIHLHGNPTLIPSWASLPWGARMTIANPLSQFGIDTVDAVIEGYTETFNAIGWDVTLATSPYRIYRVSTMAATLGETGEFATWLDFDTLTLATAVDTVATSWQVNASPLDTTVADDLPRPMRINGELITVTACSGSSAPQTWTVTRSVNGVVKAHAAGEAIDLSQPFVMEP